MKSKFSMLAFLNKLQVATPFILLLGCDGSRGDESFVALVTTFILAVLLSLLESLEQISIGFWKLLKISSACVFISIFAYATELIFFSKMGTLHGVIEIYGIPRTLCFLSVMLLVFSVISAWVGNRAKLKH